MDITEKIYYSLDIETSGFDPERCEILEVGFVGFKIQDSRFKIVERWSKVFKPKGEVNPHVLGLTGISQKELDGGADFGEYRAFLQDKLGAAIIVGHNVGFDVRFLEKSGIIFSGKTIDTMDLVQFLLPTHHSYNLENLMHLFSISHKEAHRALPDAVAAMRLLERLVLEYGKLPITTQKEIAELAQRVNAPWQDLFVANPDSAASRHKNPAYRKSAASVNPLALDHQSLYTTGSFVGWKEIVANLAGQTAEQLLIVVPKRHQVFSFWKQGLVRGFFSSRFLLSGEKLKALSQKEPFSYLEALFLMKVSVWQATNWQQECVLDLNLSFAGGQFKEMVCGAELPGHFMERVLCCDQQTFLETYDKSFLNGRTVVMLGLGEFERAITATLGQKSSWGHIRYLLRSFYDPETEAGNPDFKDAVIKALADVDLFFGLAGALLLKLHKGYGEIVLDENIRNSFEYSKIVSAAGHLCEKLATQNVKLGSQEISEACLALQDMFKDDSNFVKWVTLSETKCVFHSLPLDISGIVNKCFSFAPKFCFVENANSPEITNYFARRLGLPDLNNHQMPGLQAEMPFLRKTITRLLALFRLSKGMPCVIVPQQELSGLIRESTTSGGLPAVVVFSDLAEVSEYYRQNYGLLNKQAFLLAQQVQGGSNKLFHNFAIRKNSLLLITGKAILRFLRNPQQVKPVEHISTKILVINVEMALSVENPYIKALSGLFADPEQEFRLPLALYDLQSILQFFHTPKLKKVYVIIGKKSHKHKRMFINYLSRYFDVLE